MSIKLNVRSKEEGRVKKLGALWIPDEKIWVIPDAVKDINPFKKWLPEDEGHIVQRPYFVARTERACLKCGKETPLIALGAKHYQALFYETEEKATWTKIEYPILFCDIGFLEEEVIRSLQEYYPFFQLADLDEESEKFWVNTCIHCHAIQEDVYNFMDGNPPLSPITIEDMRQIRIIYFKLNFDYYISAGWVDNPLFVDIIQ